jgi:hypothetical protein
VRCKNHSASYHGWSPSTTIAPWGALPTSFPIMSAIETSLSMLIAVMSEEKLASTTSA